MIAGIGGGVALAGLAAARRIESAYPRFLTATRAFDALIEVQTPDNGPGPTPEQQGVTLEPIRKDPSVIDSSVVELYIAEVLTPSGHSLSFPEVFPIASADGRIGTTINRIKYLEGRAPDPTRIDEAVTSPSVAALMGVDVGGHVRLRVSSSSGRTSDQSLTIVGIGVMAGQVDASAGGYIPTLVMTPAFYRAHTGPGERQGPVLAVRTRGGSAGVDALVKRFQARGAPIDGLSTQRAQAVGLQRTIRFDTVGLRLFAALTGLAVLAIFGQLLARQIFLDSREHASLRALGMTRDQMTLLSVLRTGVVALGAAVLTAATAVALSPVTPSGPTRVFDLGAGVHVDGLVVGVGAAAIVVLVVLLGAVPALRSERWEHRTSTARSEVGTVANALARASFPPPAVAGVQMALEPGRGSTAVPVRTTIVGAALALAAVTFGGSLHHLLATPRLSGWNFDFLVADTPETIGAYEKKLVADGTIASDVRATLGEMRIGKETTLTYAFDTGAFGPSIISGRAPEGSGEIALGPRTARALGASIGDKIPVTLLTGFSNQPVSPTPAHVRVVGLVVVPQLFFATTDTGHGAAVSMDFLRANEPAATAKTDSIFLRLPRGISLDQGVARIRAVVPAGNPFVAHRSQPKDLANLSRIANLPQVLAGLLALLATGTLAHTLITSIRRRSRDFAILKTMGFVRGQVRTTVVWQATTVVAIAATVGIPVGAIAGRWGWHAFVSQLGFVPESTIPVLQVLLSIPAAFLVANLIASVPSRVAARTHPAVTLRSE